jgi:CheY-like chemotaxis protein
VPTVNKILLVEDDAVTGGIYRSKLQMEGFDVAWAKDGEEALALMTTFRPGLILAELMLPKLSGVEILKRVRAKPETKDLPVFLLVNAYVHRLVQEACKAGASKCLSKIDTTPKQLVQLISETFAAIASSTPAPPPPPTRVDTATHQILEAMRSILQAQTPAAPLGPRARPPPAAAEPTPEAKPAPTAPVAPAEPLRRPQLETDERALAAKSTDTPAPPASPTLAAAPTPETAPVPAAPTATAGPAPLASDLAFDTELRRTFLQHSPQWVGVVQTLWWHYCRAASDAERLPLLLELCRKVHWFAGAAAVTEVPLILLVVAPFEAFLLELCEKPNNFTSSTRRTIARVLDSLPGLVNQALTQHAEPTPRVSILVVDDDESSRLAITQALDKANLKSVNVADPLVACTLLPANAFDLVITGVDMPGLNGLQLCERLRAFPQHKDTPVIFVTRLNEFSTRAQAVMSGGSDFITKPFLPTELVVKVMLHLVGVRAKVGPATPRQ